MRVAIGPVDIAGIAGSLAAGLREQGHHSTLALSEPHRFGYDDATAGWLRRALQRSQAAWTRHRAGPLPAKLATGSLARGTAWLLLLTLLVRHDAFVYLFARTYTNSPMELRLLKLCRRKIVFVYCGSDLRPAFMDGPSIYAAQATPDPAAHLVAQLHEQRQRIAVQERYATVCVAGPSYAHFLTRPFISLTSLGLASRVAVGEDRSERDSRQGPPIAVHAPSDPRVKGTDVVLSAVERLRNRGVDLDLRLLAGVPHSVVVRALESCDFVIDQVYSDLALATLGVEAAHLGKPTVLAGYFAERVREASPAGTVPPSLYVMPEELEGAIERMATNPDLRAVMGREASAFVSREWGPPVVAGRLIDVLLDKDDPTLWHDPSNIEYVLGCGVSSHDYRIQLHDLIERFGLGALQLDDKPWIIQAMHEFLDR